MDDYWATVGDAVGGTALGSGGGSTLRSGVKVSTLGVGGASTLRGVGGSILRTGGGSNLGTGSRDAVGGVTAWAVKMLERCQKVVAWLADGGRMGPARAGWKRASVRDFAAVIDRYMEDGVGMATLVGNQEMVSVLH